MHRQPLVTDFNHVALILKNDSMQDDFYILESVKTGVRVVKWSNIAPYIGSEPNQFITQVCYRRLNVERTTSLKKHFIEFANNTIGQTFGFTATKLRRQTTIKEKSRSKSLKEFFEVMWESIEGKVSTVDQSNHSYIVTQTSRSFLSSELVARAYRELGIMEEDERLSSMFIPQHFSSNYSLNDEYLKLTSGITMDKERVVVAAI